MTGRALLLGCPDPGLVGTLADLTAMVDLARQFGFTDITTLHRGTRAAILAALAALVARTAPGDPVLLYYSGHGWRKDLPSGRGGPRDFQGIAPADLHDTTATDFRGILADELSTRVDRLTRITANVTTIFDCCHATDVTRGPDEPVPIGVRTLPVPWTIAPDQLYARLQAMGLAHPRFDPESNPSAVQLFACHPHEEAGEDRAAPGGLLTRALVATLAEPGAADFTWDEVLRRIDARIQNVRASQHPVVVGPAHRRVFSLETRTDDGATACIVRGGRPWIVGGVLTDVRVGDRFRGEQTHLEVEDVHLQRALARADGPITDGTTVRPFAWSTPRAHVDIAADLPDRTAVVAALSATGLLTCVQSPALPTIAALVAGATNLEIRRPDGVPVDTRINIDAAYSRLACMARVAVLRGLTSVASLDPETHAFDLEWARVDPRQPLVPGASLPRSASITARVTNRGRETLYVTLFAAEAAGRITLLTRSQPTGVELFPGRTYNLGEDRYHGIRGLPLPGPPRPGDLALVAFVLSTGVPLGAWETTPGQDTRGTPPSFGDTFPDAPLTHEIAVLDVSLVSPERPPLSAKG